jgi:hypothetical protein
MGTKYYTAASIGGFIADQHHSLDWLFGAGSKRAGNEFGAFFSHVGAFAMGAHI